MHFIWLFDSIRIIYWKCIIFNNFKIFGAFFSQEIVCLIFRHSSEHILISLNRYEIATGLWIMLKNRHFYYHAYFFGCDTSTSTQVLNCGGVVLKIYLYYKLQCNTTTGNFKITLLTTSNNFHSAMLSNCESLAHKVVTKPTRP